MRRISRFATIPAGALLLMGTAYSPSWKDTPAQRWTEDDATQVLSDSPWAKNVHLDKVRNLSVFERRDGGDWEAGIPSGIGKRTLGLLADWRDIEQVEHDYAVSQLGNVTVRWESAPPVRSAAAKVGEPALPDWTARYYAIAVHDLRPPFRWNLENQLKGVAYLKWEKRSLKPARVLVVPRAEGLATLVYLFPRSVEVTKKDRTLDFVAQIGRLFVATQFIPDEMRLDGQLQL
jgi:hypothetical protein